MPRSYSYDHFTAQKQSSSRTLRQQAKQRYTESELVQTPVPEVHYGHRFAQTEARLHQRGDGHGSQETRELAEPMGELPEPRPQVFTTPIGAVPGEEATEEGTASWRGLWAEGERAARSLAGAGREARSATARLARLPLSALRVAAGQADRLRKWAQGERPWS
jgi:hypothetical protein